MRTLEARILDPTHLELSEPIVAFPPGRSIEISIPWHEERKSRETNAREAFAGRAPASAPHRDRELAWRRSHEDVLEAYAGQWVVLEGEELVAHGPDPAMLVEKARSQGIRIPYVFYVEEFRPDVVRIGL